jgi:hypothetical protein
VEQRLEDFIDGNPDAAMITLGQDGTPHMARIELAVVDGQLWSSGSSTLVRTRNLRRDRRCSLFVFGPHPHWVGLETEVTLLDGPEAPSLHVLLMRARHKGGASPGMVLGHDDELGHDRPYPEDEYVAHVRAQGRLIYQFAVHRAYGNY